MQLVASRETETMASNLSPKERFNMIVFDFKESWNSLASNKSAGARGNFMFALQSMILLEFASRLCNSDSAGKALQDLSNALHSRDPRYFTPLPQNCCKTNEFTLPYYGLNKERQLLWVIFDLIRNGQAHQYQQILVQLSDGMHFGISLTGPAFGRHLSKTIKSRSRRHLSFSRDQDNDIWLAVYPDVLFLDLKRSIMKANLFNRGLSFTSLVRPKKPLHPFYQFNSQSLESSLLSGGHKKKYY